MAEKKEVKRFTLEGRLLASALFERDVYTDKDTGKEGEPQYRVHMSTDWKLASGENTIEDAILDAVIEEWGADAENEFLDGKIKSPFRDGDEIAKEREREGKKADAYKGLAIFNANTQFNRNGERGPGGVAVYDEDAKLIEAVNQSQIYNGCYGIAGFTIDCYKMGRERGVKFYLVAFQKTKDGDRLSTGSDHSDLFKPVGRAADGDSGGRRSRRG